MTRTTQAPEDGDTKKRDLLTDREAAELMGWHWQKVQRLRLEGKLPFYPGRPPLIEPADLEKLKVRRATPEVNVESPPSAGPAPRSRAPYTLAAEKDAPEQLARRKWLRMRRNFPR
jgi:hypothetical protein